MAVVAVVAVGGDEARERGSCFPQDGRRWLPPHWRAQCWHRRGFPWYGSQNDPYFENVGAVFLQREGNWEKSDKRSEVRRLEGVHAPSVWRPTCAVVGASCGVSAKNSPWAAAERAVERDSSVVVVVDAFAAGSTAARISKYEFVS